MYGFYTPDLAMHDIKVGDVLIVTDKEYNHIRDMMYWEFKKAESYDDL